MALEADAYNKLLSSLSGTEKEELRGLYEKKKEIQRGIIRKAIEDDRYHLQIVNFCINPFYQRSFLHSRTGYMFTRVEPFYNLGLKDFDAAIYNPDNKILILVECKSSSYDPANEIDDILETIKVSESNHALLEKVIGARITDKEYALCSSSSIIHKFKPAVLHKNANICLWSADLFENTLFLEKLAEDTTLEIKSGRLHKDAYLRQLLLNGVKCSTGSVPTITFLPSSHPYWKLVEVHSLLSFYMEKEGTEKFRVSDIQKILEKEPALINLTSNEIFGLANQIVKLGLEIKIFVDETPTVTDALQKEFSSDVKRAYFRTTLQEIERRYIEFNASMKAEEDAVNEFLKKRPTLEQYQKS